MPKPSLAEKIQIPPLSFSLQPPEEQTDNWDDDFEEGISLTKLHGPLFFLPRFVSDPRIVFEKPAPESDSTTSSAEENAKTIRPNKSPAAKAPIPLAKPPPDEMDEIDEDYSDLIGGEDEAVLESKVADFKVCFDFHFRLTLLSNRMGCGAELD